MEQGDILSSIFSSMSEEETVRAMWEVASRMHRDAMIENDSFRTWCWGEIIRKLERLMEHRGAL